MYNIIERYGAYLSKELYIGSVEELENGLEKFTHFINEHGIGNSEICGMTIDDNGNVVEKYYVNKIDRTIRKKTISR